MEGHVTKGDHIAHRDPIIALVHLRRSEGILHLNRRLGRPSDTWKFEPETVPGEFHDFSAMLGSMARNNIAMLYEKSLQVSRKQPPEPWRGAGDVGLHEDRGSERGHREEYARFGQTRLAGVTRC